MRRIISLLLENESGALSRVVGLFSQRAYNVAALTVVPIEDPGLSRMTVVTTGDERLIEQITKQLNKLVGVLKVSDLSEGDHIEREIVLVKVRADGANRDEVKRTADIFRGQIVDVTPHLYTVQLVGTSDKLDAFIRNMSETTEVVEVVRSGVCGVSRGETSLRA